VQQTITIIEESQSAETAKLKKKIAQLEANLKKEENKVAEAMADLDSHKDTKNTEHEQKLKHLEKTLEREKDIYERTMKSLSKENQAALKDLVHEHATIQKELKDEVKELSKEVMAGKLKLANMLTTQNTKIKEYEGEIEELNDAIKYQYQAAHDHHLKQIDKLKGDLQICDASGKDRQESSSKRKGKDVDPTPQEDDDEKTTELKKKFIEEKEKMDKVEQELREQQQAHAAEHKKMMEKLIQRQKTEGGQFNDQNKWKGNYGKSDLTYKDYLDGAPKKKFDANTTSKDINYYSFLCGQYDTHCDPCGYKAKRKAGCPAGSFCFEKKKVAQCGSCKKWGDQCEKCSLAKGCLSCRDGFWLMGGHCFKSKW